MRVRTQKIPDHRFRRRGFTLVELIIVITVITILATIGMFSFVNVQKQTRDSTRSADVNVIAEALENYYSHNGEYPSCSAMTKSADDVTTNTLKGLDSAMLQAPTSSPADGNSIICSDLTDSSGSNVYAYVGDGSTDCTSGAACLEWTLKYREEATGQIKTIHSRHTTDVVTSGSTTISATAAGDTQVNVSWTAVPGAVSYQLQQATNSGFSTGVVTQTVTTTSTSQTGLNPGTTYYYRVMPNATSSEGDWSNITSATTTISPPTGTPTVTATLVSGNTIARGMASGAGVCATGLTLEYSIQYNSTNTSSDGSWSGYAVETTRDQSANQGNKYTFQARARCVGPSAGSVYVTSATASVIPPIVTPSAPGWGAAGRPTPTTWSAGYNYSVGYTASCPAGTSIGPEGVEMYNTGYTGTRYPTDGSYHRTPFSDYWYLAWNAGEESEYVNYYGQYRCVTAYDSVWSPITHVQVNIVCEAGRRSFSAYPRCDGYGQNQAAMPYGN